MKASQFLQQGDKKRKFKEENNIWDILELENDLEIHFGLKTTGFSNTPVYAVHWI